MMDRQDSAISPRSLWRWQSVLGAAVLLMGTLAAYGPALHGTKLWDDDVWIADLEPLAESMAGLWRLWSDPQALQQYYPVTGTSFWLDLRLWGDAMFPRHVENVLLHVGSALLLWRLLLRLSVPGAWLAAMLFALHPLMAESVAWVSERKNVLSLPLYLGALLAYVRFKPAWTGQERPGEGRKAIAYVVTLLLFIGAMLAKVTAFSFPVVTLVIGWWKLGGIQWRRDVLPLLPMFFIAVLVGALVYWLEQHHAGARGEDWELTWHERCVIAGQAWWFYLCKMVWPLGLCPVYPRWMPEAASWQQWIPFAGVLICGAALWIMRRRVGRAPLAVFLIYGLTLWPVLGFLNVYGMLYSFVADRWVYVSSIAPLALLGAILVRLVRRWKIMVVVPASAMLLVTLAILTWRHAVAFSSSEELWRAALAGNSECWVACNNLAGELVQQGRASEARPLYQRAIVLRPQYAEAHGNLGLLLFAEGQMEKALGHFVEASKMQPDNVDFQVNIGNAQMRLGRMQEALASYRSALDQAPQHTGALINLGNALLQAGDIAGASESYRKALEIDSALPFAHHGLGSLALHGGDVREAEKCFARALELDPGYAEAHNSLGNLRFQARRLDEALASYEQAVSLNGRYAEALYNLANTCLELGRMAEAREGYERVLGMQPENVPALNNLAWVLATAGASFVRDGAAAVQWAQKADQLTGHSHAIVLHTLAAALAEAGDFDGAVRAAEKALAVSESQRNVSMSAAIRDQMAHYARREPYRDPRDKSSY